jgi:hypothetical protein
VPPALEHRDFRIELRKHFEPGAVIHGGDCSPARRRSSYPAASKA